MVAPPIVFITGALGGLGQNVVKAFWAAGWSVALSARNVLSLEGFRDNLVKKNKQTIALFPCDLSKPELVADLAKQVRFSLPRLDAVVNAAAIHGPIGPFISNDLLEWKQAMQVNFFAPLMLCQTFGAWMKEYGNGSIINLSGGGASASRPNFSAYACSKTALVRFSETFAAELRGSGVRVNCVAPGAMPTQLLREVLLKNPMEAGEKEVVAASQIFKQGVSSLTEVSSLILFLAGSASNGITGKLISAVWDNWQEWPLHLPDLDSTDLYTLRRVTARDRGFNWGDR